MYSISHLWETVWKSNELTYIKTTSIKPKILSMQYDYPPSVCHERGPLEGFGGVCMSLVWSFHVFRTRPYPHRYLHHLYVVCHHIIWSYLAVSRPCCLSEFYPKRVSLMVMGVLVEKPVIVKHRLWTRYRPSSLNRRLPYKQVFLDKEKLVQGNLVSANRA